MKNHLAILLITLTTWINAGLFNAGAAVEVSAHLQINAVADFYEPLTPMGTWVEVSPYGRCWQPARIEANWQPYSNGHWEWTEAGWYWVSDEPWSWACYHYGYWVMDRTRGWCWAPGVDWAPAWVTWRVSDDHIGWAPCGPNFTVMAPSLFVFVDVHRFHSPLRRSQLIVNDSRIISRTRVINNFERQTVNLGGSQRSVYVNRGPDPEPIQRVTGTKFTPRPLTEVIRQTPAPETLRRTGRDQERNQERTVQPPATRTTEQQPQSGQQPSSRTTEQQPSGSIEKQPATAPQGQRERNVVPEQKPAAEIPSRSTQPRELSPTGREQPPVTRELPQPSPDPRREVTPPSAPQPRREVPLTPTGRDPEQTLKQPPTRTPEQQPATPPPGQRERNVVPGQKPASEVPTRPVQPRELPPTGREQPPVTREMPQPKPAPRPEMTPPSAPQPRREAPLPPTGRESVVPPQRPVTPPTAPPQGPQTVPPQQRPPVAPPTPVPRETVPPGHDPEKDKDKEQPRL